MLRGAWSRHARLLQPRRFPVFARGLSGTYEPQAVESKWQRHWDAVGTPERVQPERQSWPAFYALSMFPYPSGARA